MKLVLLGSILGVLAISSPAAPAATGHCARTITNGATGKTVTLKRGACATLRLSGLTWSKPTTSSSARVRVASTSAAGTWRLTALRKGAATITSTGRPHCAAGIACPQFAALFRFTIKVN